jgi:hypothetical protein
MSERNDELAERMRQQVVDFIEFLSPLTESDVRSPCPDEGFGTTVSAIAAHIAAGYGRAAMILQPAHPNAARRGAGGSQHVGPHMGPRPVKEAEGIDIKMTIHRLRTHGMEVVDLIQRYPESALRRPLPTETARFANLGKPVDMIIEYMIYLQAAHLHTMKRAVADRRGSAGREQGSNGRETQDRFSA